MAANRADKMNTFAGDLDRELRGTHCGLAQKLAAASETQVECSPRSWWIRLCGNGDANSLNRACKKQNCHIMLSFVPETTAHTVST